MQGQGAADMAMTHGHHDVLRTILACPRFTGIDQRRVYSVGVTGDTGQMSRQHLMLLERRIAELSTDGFGRPTCFTQVAGAISLGDATALRILLEAGGSPDLPSGPSVDPPATLVGKLRALGSIDAQVALQMWHLLGQHGATFPAAPDGLGQSFPGPVVLINAP